MKSTQVPTNKETKATAAFSKRTVEQSGKPIHAGATLLQQSLGNRNLGSLIQTKLYMSQPGDAREEEADRVADQIMRMPWDGPGALRGSIQRKCHECEQDATVRRASDESGIDVERPQSAPPSEWLVMRKVDETQSPLIHGLDEDEENRIRVRASAVSRSDRPSVSPKVESTIYAARGQGQSLPDGVRNFFEARLNADLSSVRVHTGAAPESAARSLRARAFTVGSDIFFGAGHYRPDSARGRRLMAHELTHVIQQSSPTAVPSVDRSPVDETLVIVKRVRFPFVSLGIPADTPGQELRIRFAMWYWRITREDALKHIASSPASYASSWSQFSDETRQAGVITVSLVSTVAEFSDQLVDVDSAEGTLPTGRSEGHEDRAEEFGKLPSKTQKQVNTETDGRYWGATGLSREKIKKGENAKAELWLRFRDQVLAEREYLHSLPERVKRFMSLSGGMGTTEFLPSDQPQLIRISKMVMDMSDAELNDYLSRVEGLTDDLDRFERMLEDFLAEARKDEDENGDVQDDDKKPKRGSKYGRYGLIDLPQEIITVLEAAAELLGDVEELTDFLDLLDEITELHDRTATIVELLGNPDHLILIALGILDNAAAADLDQWVFKPEPKAKKKSPKLGKKKGIKSVLSKIRRAQPVIKKVLKPIFAGRRRSMAVQFRTSLIIDQLPDAVTKVLASEVGRSSKDKKSADVRTLSDAAVAKIVADLQEIPEALSRIESTEDLELVNKEELGRVVAKLVVRLAGGVYGKVASKVGLDEVIADIAKHGTKYTIPDEIVDSINDGLNTILTEFKPLIAEAGSEATEVLTGIDTLLSEQLTAEFTELVSPKAKTSCGASLPSGEEDFHRLVANSRGAPMSQALRDRIQPFVGREIGPVTIHADGAASAANDAIDADAFTIGRDVYFGKGKLDERSKDGLGLIAHELTHVVQNANSGSTEIRRSRKSPKELRTKVVQRLLGRVLRGTAKTGDFSRRKPFVDYGSLDRKGRPIGIIALLRQPRKGGSKASPRIRPPGFRGGAAGHARCHLLGNQLGGDGREPRNLVACFHNRINNSWMKERESKVRRAVDAGESVLYTVIPSYNLKGPYSDMPDEIRMTAQGDGASGTDFEDFDDKIKNRK